jgi:hypothetical protein
LFIKSDRLSFSMFLGTSRIEDVGGDGGEGEECF